MIYTLGNIKKKSISQKLGVEWWLPEAGTSREKGDGEKLITVYQVTVRWEQEDLVWYCTVG
jgi:hypothetical protein